MGGGGEVWSGKWGGPAGEMAEVGGQERGGEGENILR